MAWYVTSKDDIWVRSHKPIIQEGAMTDAGRWRGNDDVGKSHGGIPPPIWHPAGGENKGKKAYPATESQSPPSYSWTKFSKSIKDAVANMLTIGNPQGKSKDDSAAMKEQVRNFDQHRVWS